MIDEVRRFSEILDHLAANAVAVAVEAVSNNDYHVARQVISKKEKFNLLVDSAVMHEAQHLSSEGPNRLQSYTIEVAVIDKLKRIYDYTKRMAKTVSPPVPREWGIYYRTLQDQQWEEAYDRIA